MQPNSANEGEGDKSKEKPKPKPKPKLKTKCLSFPNVSVGNPEVLNIPKALDPRQKHSRMTTN
ncbi:MAG: hypothetical protein COA54_08265 [Thiotrichaceae bacterium]|nr:MAG: hypothetical protein COA54_08265 [Thiotrichaceae bacterium]